MSKYTTELRYLVETGYDLGLKDYPIYSEDYRAKLNDKIIKHYYFREIGFETAALFKYYLNTTMAEIMPYYNQLYESALLEYDPLTTHRMTDTYERGVKEGINKEGNANQEGTTDKSNSSDTSSNGTSVYSDFPQSMLPAGSIDGIQYASNATVDKNTTNINGNENTTLNNQTTTNESESRDTTENTKRTTEGYDANVSELMMSYRKTLLNIDMMVIKELESLFMQVW